jgi:hypothetical protein
MYKQLVDEMDDARQSIAALKQAGRATKTAGEKLHSTRTQEATAAIVNGGVRGVGVGADLLVPFLGTGLSAALSTKAMVDAHKSGQRKGTELARQGIPTAAGFIPVVGPFIGFCLELSDLGEATLQSGKSRTKKKVAKTESLLSSIEQHRAMLAPVREALSEYTGEDKQDLERRLQKAVSRMDAAEQAARDWLDKKSAHMTLPLLSDSSSSAMDMDTIDTADEADEKRLDMWRHRIDGLRDDHEIFRLLECSGNCPYDIGLIYGKETDAELIEVYGELLKVAAWRLSAEESTQIRGTPMYRQWMPRRS